MRIEDYFAIIRKTVESSPIVRLSNVTYEKRGTYVGIIRGRLHFVDDTILEWREYVDTETKDDRLMYVYQYMDSLKKLVFRYDNTGHHKKSGLSTYPHHKHGKRGTPMILCVSLIVTRWEAGRQPFDRLRARRRRTEDKRQRTVDSRQKTEVIR